MSSEHKDPWQEFMELSPAKQIVSVIVLLAIFISATIFLDTTEVVLFIILLATAPPLALVFLLTLYF